MKLFTWCMVQFHLEQLLLINNQQHQHITNFLGKNASSSTDQEVSLIVMVVVQPYSLLPQGSLQTGCRNPALQALRG